MKIRKTLPPEELKREMDAPVPGLGVQATRRHGRASQALFEHHWHDHFQLLRVRSGVLLMRCRSGLVEVHAGEILVLHPGEIHFSEALPDPQQEVDFDVIKMEFTFLESAHVDACQVEFLEPLRAGRLVFESLVRDPEIGIGIDALLREAQAREDGFALTLKGTCLLLLARLVRHHLGSTLSASEAARHAAQQERLGAVLSRLERDFREDIPLSELARLAGLCESHFCRVFRSLTGRSPVEHRNRLRLAAARELLSGSSAPVEEIAFACGFRDPNYFSRVFRNLEGFSPLECRKRAGKEKQLSFRSSRT